MADDVSLGGVGASTPERHHEGTFDHGAPEDGRAHEARIFAAPFLQVEQYTQK